MKFLSVFAVLLIVSTNVKILAQSAADFADLWEKQHITRQMPSDLRHADLVKYLEQLKSLGLKVETVGKSYAGRAVYQVEWGKGGTKILMWSQMHGDEPTATAALIDMLAFLQKNRNLNWVKELENSLTIRAVPMLNPDGAELFQRRNLQAIDINRDARNLQTPEGRLLKNLRDDWQPDLGFNLHNQNGLTTAGRTANQSAISLLAVSGDPQGRSDAKHIRSKRICAVMIAALNQFIKNHVARYDDSYNPRAFGDMISAWGTPVILVETGLLHGKDEMFLTKLNFVAYLAALKSVADKSEQRADPKVYDDLPNNDDGNIYNVIFRRANVVDFAQSIESFTGDVAVNFERRRASEIINGYVPDVGDLSVYAGLDEYDASGFYLVAKTGQIKIGSPAEFRFYKKSRKINWQVKDLEHSFPPDAIFKNGKWAKGEKLVPKIKK